MKKQYIVQKYVMADSVKQAIDKSKNLPIHEVFVHNSWFEKVGNYEWTQPERKLAGYKKK